MADDGGRRDGRRGITRRDFLDGTAITAAGLAAAAAAPHLTGAEAALLAKDGPLPKGYYPPAQTGLVGQPNRVVRKVMQVDGRPNPADPHSAAGGAGLHPGRVRDTGETYDCVIVGAGISGLATAKWYRDRFGQDSRILLIDPLPDFGGHAHRNELHVPDAARGGADTTLLRYGGAINLDSIGTWNRPAGSPAAGYDIPGSYGQPALDMLAYLGVTPDAFPDTAGPGLPAQYGLRPMLLFPKEDWGQDHLVPNKTAAQDWASFLATTPFSPQAQAELARFMTDTTTDYIAAKDGPKTDAEKKAILSRISYKRYLLDYAGLSEEATLWFQRNSHGLYGAGIQAVQAGDLWLLEYPGFEGLALEPGDFPGVGRTAQMDAMEGSDPTVAWPDGNASVARLLVSRLIPDAFEGPTPTQETIVNARCRYDRLDRGANLVRIRLNSFVYDVRPARRGRALAAVEYVLRGQGRRVRGRHVVMACWNRVTAHIVEGLPPSQVEDLTYARKVPLIYGRAGLRNWKAFADAKIASVSPRGNSLFWDSTSLVAGQKFGDVYGPTPNDPSEPAILNFTCVPTDPSQLTQLSAYEAGREKLLHMSLRDLEAAVIDVLDRSVNRAGGDFEPERDIESFMINRWNYGYAYELASLFDPSLYGRNADQPHVRGRVPFRNVAIANSDSGAFAYTHSAIDEGYRAVQDLPA